MRSFSCTFDRFTFTVRNGAVSDGLFNVFFRLHVQKTYDGVLATPMRVPDIALGEMLAAMPQQVLLVTHNEELVHAMPTTIRVARALRDAGIVDCRREGRWAYYWLRPEAFEDLGDVVKLLGPTPVKSAQFVTKPIVPGQQVAVVGLSPDFRTQSQSSAVASVQAAGFPLSRTLRFRDTNLDLVSLVNAPSDFDGTLVDFQGRVLGMWASFAYQTGRDLTQVNMGIQSDVVVDMLEKLRKKEPLRSIEVEWSQMPLATARKVDLPDAWVQKYEAHNPEKREVLAVSTSVGGSVTTDHTRESQRQTPTMPSTSYGPPCSHGPRNMR